METHRTIFVFYIKLAFWGKKHNFYDRQIINDPQCPSVRRPPPSVRRRPSAVRRPESYNLPNRNTYEKSVITKKLRIDKIRCNEKLFFQNTLFFGLRKIISRKKHV